MSGCRYAVLIGNRVFPEEHTDKLPELRCPVRDAEAMSELLASEKHGGYVTTLLKDQSRNIVWKAIFRALRQAKADDRVLIYYSGHGKLDEEGRLHLATNDTTIEDLPITSVAVDDLGKHIGSSRASSVIVILDCCFSGAVRNLFKTKGDLTSQVETALNEASRAAEGAGQGWLTAGTDTQLAAEKPEDEYSLLTKYIVRGIREGKADERGDGKVTFAKLCAYVEREVPKEGTQKPKHWSLEATGDVTVAFTGREPFEVQRDAIRIRVYDLAREGVLSDDEVSTAISILRSEAHDLDRHSVIEALYSKLESKRFVREIIDLVQPAQDGRQRKNRRQPAQLLVEKAHQEVQANRAKKARAEKERKAELSREAIKAELARKARDAKKAAKARQIRQARKTQEARKAAEIRKADEAREAERVRKAQEARENLDWYRMQAEIALKQAELSNEVQRRKAEQATKEQSLTSSETPAKWINFSPLSELGYLKTNRLIPHIECHRGESDSDKSVYQLRVSVENTSTQAIGKFQLQVELPEGLVHRGKLISIIHPNYVSTDVLGVAQFSKFFEGLHAGEKAAEPLTISFRSEQPLAPWNKLMAGLKLDRKSPLTDLTPYLPDANKSVFESTPLGKDEVRVIVYRGFIKESVVTKKIADLISSLE